MILELRDVRCPGDSLREVLLSFAAGLREDIEKLPEDATTRIHDIRVSTKKIRALLRLANSAIPEPERKAIIAQLREIKDIFSGSRDEEVMRLRLEQLLPDGEAAAAITRLGLAPAETTNLPETGRGSELSRELVDRLSALDFEPITFDVIVENAAKSYRKARKLWRQCEKASRDDIMHQWRKRVKDITYHALALSSLKPMKKLAVPLDALAECLGDYHDLALLGERSKGDPEIAGRLKTMKSKSERRCFRAAEEVFEQKPGELRKKLAKGDS